MRDLREPITGVRDEAAEARFLAGIARIREGAIQSAKALLELVDGGHLEAERCASVAQFGERHGISGADVMRLYRLGWALNLRPDYEAHLVRGRLSLHAASILGELPWVELEKRGDVWLGRALSMSAKDLRREVERCVEEVRLKGKPAIPLLLYVSRKGRDEFERARTVASRKARKILTKGAALEAISSHYLASFDPLRVKDGPRRLPDTALLDTLGIRSRYVPAIVARAVMGRLKGRCQVPFCPHQAFAQLAHVVAHAKGGCRERWCLVWLCTKHHAMFDQGLIRMKGSAESPTFLDSEGNDLSKRIAVASSAAIGPPGAEENATAPT
jgi:hypothetical protein